MIIGCLVLGVLCAFVSAAWALLSGFSILAALGVYILAGSVTTVAVGFVAAWRCHRRGLIVADRPRRFSIQINRKVL